MATLTQKYNALKQRVGGNREIRGYEETFGMPREEQFYLTPPNKMIRRILGEIEFAIRLSDVNNGKFDADIDNAIEFLSAKIDADGVLTNAACMEAEDMMMSMAEAAKEYKLILAGHAHIDMNWMWSWHETVAATLATFRTMLTIMEEYPEFTFSQSQASVYKIVEDFDPDMMDEIKQRIAEGRWEITASAWVETDKNMPNTESLLRHIKYTKNYLRDVWGINPDSLEVDFSPDTFGHSANVPEIDVNGGVKYYYHCRALNGKQALYRWKAQSGAEVLVYREQYWYNSAITPKIGAGLIDISQRSAGLKTGLIVYGVGDHGGGPTRRDVERAIEMMEWRIYPRIKFGTFIEFFKEAEAVRDQLPVEEHELNYFAPGCYTTQSRIKMGNRHCEAALANAENLSVLATGFGKGKFRSFAIEKAWRDVLFTHFHDILTGSCVQDSREHAMGLYSNSLAVAQTESLNAMSAITANIDTSMVEVDECICAAQSEGAGAGYGVENFAGTPIPERGVGLTRIFTVFNAAAVDKSETVEITVWDWVGDLRYAAVTDVDGNPIEFQLIDHGLQQYWDHKYFRVLVKVDVKALGYTTVVLKQAEMSGFYPVYYQNENRSTGEALDFVLDNEYITAKFNRQNGSLYSLVDKETNKEYIKDGQFASFVLIDTERASSSAWNIGHYLSVTPITKAVNLRGMGGGLRKGFYYETKVLGSTIKTTVTLEKGARSLKYAAEVDWHEIGKETVPVLAYSVPVNYNVEKYRYNIPAGYIDRAPREEDVPGLSYAAALSPDGGRGLAIATDCKYGYRGTNAGELISTLINSSTSPDPYPERGIHKIKLSVGIIDDCPKVMEESAASFCHPLTYQPVGSHKGELAVTDSLFTFSSDTAVISAVTRTSDNALAIRMYAVGGAGEAEITLKSDVKCAKAIDIMENPICCDCVTFEGNKVKVKIGAAKVVTVKIC